MKANFIWRSRIGNARLPGKTRRGVHRRPTPVRGVHIGTAPPRILYVTDFYQEEVLTGIVDYVREAGWELDANMRFHGLLPKDARADGILATVSRETRVRDWLGDKVNCPVVLMLRCPFKVPYPIVEVDYVAAGRIGARHLLELGLTHFGFYWTEEAEARDVRSGFEAELSSAGRKLHFLDIAAAHPGVEPALLARNTRCHWLADRLKALPKPVAVMTDDDRRALELLGACDLSGLRVPEDVSILGCDNRFVELGTARLPLSSVDMNFQRVGREAAAVLNALMNGKPLPARTIKVSPQGVAARRSTATFVTDSPGITAAVRFLRENFRDPLRLAELARGAGYSKRTFESEFKRRVGRTPRDELQRVRLERVARLLRDTDLKLDAIAVESGFGSACQLCRVFVDMYGMSPKTWQEQLNAAG
jgi:LacI family transcriptional regulator